MNQSDHIDLRLLILELFYLRIGRENDEPLVPT